MQGCGQQQLHVGEESTRRLSGWCLTILPGRLAQGHGPARPSTAQFHPGPEPQGRGPRGHPVGPHQVHGVSAVRLRQRLSHKALPAPTALGREPCKAVRPRELLAACMGLCDFSQRLPLWQLSCHYTGLGRHAFWLYIGVWCPQGPQTQTLASMICWQLAWHPTSRLAAIELSATAHLLRLPPPIPPASCLQLRDLPGRSE